MQVAELKGTCLKVQALSRAELEYSEARNYLRQHFELRSDLNHSRYTLGGHLDYFKHNYGKQSSSSCMKVAEKVFCFLRKTDISRVYFKVYSSNLHSNSTIGILKIESNKKVILMT
jgi:hypothetical protein